MSSSKGLDTFYERLNGIWFFHMSSSLCCSPEVEVQRVQIWTVTWPGNFRPSLMTRPHNFSGVAPSCIHQSEEWVAEWRSLCQIMSCSNLSEVWNTINRRQMAIIVKERINDWNHSINNGNEDRYLNIIPIISFANISIIFICPHSVVFSMRFLMETKRLLVSPNDSINNVEWLLQNPLTKLFFSLRFVGIS